MSYLFHVVFCWYCLLAWWRWNDNEHNDDHDNKEDGNNEYNEHDDDNEHNNDHDNDEHNRHNHDNHDLDYNHDHDDHHVDEHNAACVSSPRDEGCHHQHTHAARCGDLLHVSTWMRSFSLIRIFQNRHPDHKIDEHFPQEMRVATRVKRAHQAPTEISIINVILSHLQTLLSSASATSNFVRRDSSVYVRLINTDKRFPFRKLRT